MPDGNRTVIGSNVISLSGAWEQKVALARALYSCKPILLLDDILSGLDASNSRHVFDAILGHTGLARRCGITVIFATHAAQYSP